MIKVTPVVFAELAPSEFVVVLGDEALPGVYDGPDACLAASTLPFDVLEHLWQQHGPRPMTIEHVTVTIQ